MKKEQDQYQCQSNVLLHLYIILEKRRIGPISHQVDKARTGTPEG